ncbi:MAG: cyclic pyranopterin monophosphate synthase MoaC [Candidatus Hodarchaeota archaeon]
MARTGNEDKGARRIKMIDVGEKPIITRIAIASGEILLSKATILKIKEKTLEKGDVITASKLVGIAAAKKTPDILPLCHPLSLTKIKVDIEILDEKIIVTSEVKASERTGVEMEALTATSAALLNIWDMTKMYEKDENGQYPSTSIQDIKVLKKVKQAD